MGEDVQAVGAGWGGEFWWLRFVGVDAGGYGVERSGEVKEYEEGQGMEHGCLGGIVRVTSNG